MVRHGGFKMTFGMIAFFVVFYLVFCQSMHVVGLHMTFSHLFDACAVGRLLSVIGVTLAASELPRPAQLPCSSRSALTPHRLFRARCCSCSART